MKTLHRLIKAFSLLIIVSASSRAYAANILFAQVNAGVYTPAGNQLAQMLIDDGHSVINVNLNTTVVPDFSTFDQIWVYDLFTGLDNSTNQTSNYSGIANWYHTRANKNLLVDGRIISSTPNWSNANGMSSESAWIQNYATQLDLRGGGLVLGTDHANSGQSTGAFVDGINQINGLIGVNPFSGFFGSYPSSQAVVDPLSPLFISGLDACRNAPTSSCINDNSTTSFAPAGLQPNGSTLTPLAYHGTVPSAFSNAAVASTLGSITFGTCGGPNQPPCTIQEPTTVVLLWLSLIALIYTRKLKIN